jgi:hypothetical protein
MKLLGTLQNLVHVKHKTLYRSTVHTPYVQFLLDPIQRFIKFNEEVVFYPSNIYSNRKSD